MNRCPIYSHMSTASINKSELAMQLIILEEGHKANRTQRICALLIGKKVSATIEWAYICDTQKAVALRGGKMCSYQGMAKYWIAYYSNIESATFNYSHAYVRAMQYSHPRENKCRPTRRHMPIDSEDRNSCEYKAVSIMAASVHTPAKQPTSKINARAQKKDWDPC